jgi:type I site-specific restriction endonuclease
MVRGGMQKEAKARIKINKLLEQSGWRFFDDEKGKANIVLENNVKITRTTLDEFGNDFEKTENGFTDFLLLDEKSFPFVIVEAKSEDKNPLDGKEQARKYAQSQNVRFVILSNGNLHYFWDLERGNPSVITKFPSLESLHHTGSFAPNPSTLVREIVEEDYIARIQNPLFDKDPREWERRQLRDTYITFGCESGNPTFRYSLIDAVRDGYLVNPVAVDARTEITTELLSEKGYSIIIENAEGMKEEQIYYHKDFEKKFLSEETNSILCKTFIENALRDPISGEIGKTIVFCVSQNHASKITQVLNELADR